MSTVPQETVNMGLSGCTQLDIQQHRYIKLVCCGVLIAAITKNLGFQKDRFKGKPVASLGHR